MGDEVTLLGIDPEVAEMYKGQLLTKEMKFILANLDLLKEGSRKAVAAGEVQWVDYDLYVRKKLNKAGATEILNPSTVKQVGLSYLDKNMLPELYNFAVTGVRVGFQADTAIASAQAAVYSNTGAFDPALLNGELLVTVNDKPIIEIPLARFFNPNTGGIAQTIQIEERDIIRLKAPKLIPSGTPFKIIATMADGLTIAGANNNYLEVQLLGVSTRPR
jgi:hypothetical protein